MKKISKYISLLICMTLMSNMLALVLPGRAYAAQTCEIVKVNVDGAEYEARALNHEFENNIYLSMTDLSKAMADTDRAFEVVWSQKDGETMIVLEPKSSGEGLEEEADEDSWGDFENGEQVNFTRKRMPLRIGDNDYSFYIIVSSEKNDKECYVNLSELALAMNMDISVGDNQVYINSKGEFDFNKYNLLDNGIACMADSCLVGDVTTGNIYFETNMDEVVAIASTTKLMTYLVIKDAMAKGEITDHDTITFSQKASELSKTSDGVVNVAPGDTADIMDVISAMLISSSNECALALAEHLCGNEAAFVERMNQKAVALGLSENVRFYNPHGLPVYSEEILAPKLQNHLTAYDMFMLSAHILDTYPEITDITSIKKTKLSTLGNFEATNTNVLLHNIPGVVGLKTGTTNKAQSCLVSAYKTADVKGDTHYIVTVVYGCENVQTQSYLSLVLMRYGIQKFNATELGITPERGDNNEVPADLESMIGAVINTARRNSK